jgi:hypothetical protein
MIESVGLFILGFLIGYVVISLLGGTRIIKNGYYEELYYKSLVDKERVKRWEKDAKESRMILEKELETKRQSDLTESERKEKLFSDLTESLKNE